MTGLALYRGLTNIGAPLINHYLRRRLANGKEHPERFEERRGEPSRIRPAGPLAWIHAASVGEAQSALTLIHHMLRRRTDLHVLVTTGTVTSARIMADRLPPRSFHQFVPVDRLPWIRRFLDHWDPDLAIWVESEFWPNLIHETAERNIPMALVNGRVSRRSVANWRRAPGFIRAILSCFRLCLTQTDEEASRLKGLGAQRVLCHGNLKYSAEPLPVDEAEWDALSESIDGRPVWLAASTHPGEEDIVADAHTIIKATVPNVLTLIVPRHPDRGAEITAQMTSRGLNLGRRALNDPIGPDTEIYIADTLGELGLFYRLANIAFIGGSLRDHGGHNPLEAAQLDCAILMGPDTANFASVAAELHGAQAMLEISDAASLARAVTELLSNPTEVDSLSEAAATVAAKNYAVVDSVMETLEPFLDALPHDDPYASP
ncbi:MAG: 3-deoxy-D-manno-octulosonic acid transferase [Alphaproteobacteria bacterium]|nr:3-deoxy-D-manno-octulosonic acid transferase [Alphaproteobacteria bacterium]